MSGSDLFAYLIALAVRWRLLEAFVIPTGAMAPTIYGAHANVQCQNCDTEYAVSMSRWVQMPNRREAVVAVCANCGQPSKIGPRDPIRDGDRILVEKISQPRRWDLMVFKYPEDRRVTYIKRVVGMPGETVEIADGDIFVNGHRLRRGPTEAQDMWLLVHDSRNVARRILPGMPHWEARSPSSRWKHKEGSWTFEGAKTTDDVLEFSGRLTDEIAYNDKEPGPWAAMDQPPLVGDIKLACDLERFSGDGSLELRWEFHDQKAKARISADGQAELVVSAAASAAEKGKDGEKTVRGKLPHRLSAARKVVFAVRDGHAYLMVDARLVVLAPAGAQDLAAVKQRKAATEPCRLAIVGSRCDFTLPHVVLWKDIYYRNLAQIPGAGQETGWGCTGNPIRLGKGKYFVLGDNSSRSKDSRFWGAVPAAAVVGIARWTYWPLSRWHRFD